MSVHERELHSYDSEPEEHYLNGMERMRADVYSGKENGLGFEQLEHYKARMREQSPYGCLATWDLKQCIVKTGDDLMQEQVAVQLISLFSQIFKAEKVRVLLTPYEIIPVDKDSGLVEVIKESISLH